MSLCLCFWKKKKEQKAAPIVELGITMGEVYVNPSLSRRRERNLARIATIREFIKSIPYASPEYYSFEAELKRRVKIEELTQTQGGN